MSNSINSNLVVDRLGEAVALSSGAFAPLGAVGSVVSADGPTSSVSVPLVSALPNILVNPNLFTGDSTVNAVSVQVDHLAQVANVENANSQGGTSATWFLKSLVNKFAGELFRRAIGAYATSAGYNAFMTGAASDFDLDSLTGACEDLNSSNRALVLAPAAFGKIRQHLTYVGDRWALPGFSLGVWEAPDADFASGVWGIVCDPRALVIAIGQPVVAGGRKVNKKSVEIGALGVNVTLASWAIPSTRTEVVSIEALFGVAPADTSAALIATTS